MCLLALQPVEAHQALVTISELCRISHVVDRRREPVSAMPMRHFAQLPQRVLQPFAQALNALRKAHCARLPVRVRQHEVIDQVRKTLSLYGHAQLFHVRKVGSAQPPRRMLLGEEHFPGRTFSRTPVLHATLQCAQLPVLKTAGVLPLQVLENGLGLKPCVIFKQLLNIVPNLDERVRPGSSMYRHRHLARQPASAAHMEKAKGTGPPTPISPANMAPIFTSGETTKDVEFSWTPMANAVGYRLRISRNPYFSSTLVDKRVNTADVSVTSLGEGAYYWAVRSVDGSGKESVESEKNRFTIIPKGKQSAAIALDLDPFIQHGHIIEVAGKTQVGARVMVNGREVPMISGDGSFHYFTPPLTPGEAVITVTAQTAQGGVNSHSNKIIIQ